MAEDARICCTPTIRNRHLVDVSHCLRRDILVKINGISSRRKSREQEGNAGERYVRVTLLDINDLGSVIPLKELELRLPDDESIARTLETSNYAAVFTDADDEERAGTIILANGITEEEQNKEKEKTINRVNKAQCQI